MRKYFTSFFILSILPFPLLADSGKKVFETYCWGCHHQTAVAFGSPFSEIASKRTAAVIQAMITDPAAVSKVLGYKRNAMPAFTLTPAELKAITDYIVSYKDVDSLKPKENKELNGTKEKEPYPNIASSKEKK